MSDATSRHRTCTIPGCSKRHYGHGWCQMHYRRWVNNGDPLALRTPPWPERFWVKVDRSDGCWLWTGALDHAGYGRVGVGKGRTKLAHRVAYELAVGPIPDETPHLDHLCRNTSCVRPDHLEPVTQEENNRREAAARTHCVHGHELTEENTYRRRNGSRECRTCIRARNRRTPSLTDALADVPS